MKNVKKTWVALALMGCMQVLHAQTVYLHSDNPQMRWKLKPQAEVGTDVKSLCENGYNVSAWVDAVVPGTAFNSYVIAGLEKDPNFGDNIHQVNRDKYDRSFWYRTTFRVPADFTKELIWLNFNGVNRRAEVYLNGTLLGKLDGFMHRGHFNVTSLVNRDKENVLAVLVHIPDTPLANQGSPTYLSSGGWDWMPYVPGLNSGITDKVFLTNTGTATLIDPWIRTNLPTRARADLSVALDVKNNSVEKTKVLVRGTITPGNIIFQKELEVNAHTTEQVKFDKRYFPQLCIDQPRLWWPNGYGDPNLYHCKFEVMVDGKVSETKDVSFGIKKYSYDKEGNTFHVYINDVPVFVKGANWGMSEYMLRCRGAEYDTKIRLHKEMNFNMIRNWLGSVTDDEFYEACDKYGIMVWDDFWINSNPNLPYDLNVFNNNMMEKIKRVRNHPSIAVWCGDNESNPQPPLEGWMAENIRTFDGGDRYFQANSHAQGLTGSGPWGAFEPRFYFTKYPDGLEGDPARGWGFRTEIGTAVVPTFESFKKFMPKENWWPRDEMWNKHYFGQNAFNAAPDRYDASITKGFGRTHDEGHHHGAFELFFHQRQTGDETHGSHIFGCIGYETAGRHDHLSALGAVDGDALPVHSLLRLLKVGAGDDALGIGAAGRGDDAAVAVQQHELIFVLIGELLHHPAQSHAAAGGGLLARFSGVHFELAGDGRKAAVHGLLDAVVVAAGGAVEEHDLH